MTKIKVSFCFFALFLSASIQAAYMPYVVKNYEGYIGEYPVHLSLQFYDFGKKVNVEGSYYYDNHRSPIPLYGVNESGSIVLCEAVSDESFEKYIVQGGGGEVSKCPFNLTRKSTGFLGEWHNERSALKVDLKETVEVSDGVINGSAKTLDIPFWGQTKQHGFIGVYEASTDGIVINKVNVIDKQSGKLIQVINPQMNDCEFGSYMTSIFQNIESDGSQIRLNCYSTGPDVSVNYKFNTQTSRYDVVTER
ncbi:hypothetical protein L584_10635 [Pantoea agglomerans Tx10]|uniref:hypothetical protein n=1 Tax=Enterobacter agglomerans TaxID=549 RepID=UPI0003B1CEDF|nr:hypothetical protein [Pantoea agglomerans]ERM10788.1 hypothetical protein L584_10635 [Pantoea agglomerans Tx10]